MKKRIVLAALACLALGLASCSAGSDNPTVNTSQNETPSSEGTSAPEESVVDKTFVTPEVTGPQKNSAIIMNFME